MFLAKPSISRRRFLLATLGLGAAASVPTSLTACTQLQRPTPDGVVSCFHKLALRDIEFLNSSATEAASNDALTLRSTHRDTLAAEIERSCGIHEDGSRPEECGPATHSQLPAPSEGTTVAELFTDSRKSPLILEALENRSHLQDSYEIELLTAIDGGLVLALKNLGQSWSTLVPDQLAVPEGGNIIADCRESMALAVQAEYQLIYSFGVVSGNLNTNLQTSAITSADRHRLLRDRALMLFEAAGVEAPLSDPGYVAADPGLDSVSTPAEFAAAIETQCADAWQRVVKEAKNPQLRLFALHAAGLAAAGSSIFAGRPEDQQPGLEAALSSN